MKAIVILSMLALPHYLIGTMTMILAIAIKLSANKLTACALVHS